MSAVMSNPVFREPETLGGPVREIEFRDAIREAMSEEMAQARSAWSAR